jgi:hypothetical protein
MICDNCGYENNPDDALTCSLCGKVFRKEVREDKEERKIHEFKKRPRRIYWDRTKKFELGGLIFITIFCITLAIITGIKWEPIGIKEVIQFILVVGTTGLLIWYWLKESPEEREDSLRKEQEMGADPLGIKRISKIGELAKEIKKSKGKDRKEYIIILCALIIAIIIGVILAPIIGLEKAFDWKTTEYTRPYSDFFWAMILMFWIWIGILWILSKIGVIRQKPDEKEE